MVLVRVVQCGIEHYGSKIQILEDQKLFTRAQEEATSTIQHICGTVHRQHRIYLDVFAIDISSARRDLQLPAHMFSEIRSVVMP